MVPIYRASSKNEIFEKFCTILYLRISGKVAAGNNTVLVKRHFFLNKTSRFFSLNKSGRQDLNLVHLRVRLRKNII